MTEFVFPRQESDLEVSLGELGSAGVKSIHIMGVVEDMSPDYRGLGRDTIALQDQVRNFGGVERLGKEGTVRVHTVSPQQAVVTVGMGKRQDWEEGPKNQGPNALLERVRVAAGNGFKAAAGLEREVDVSFAPLGVGGVIPSDILFNALVEGVGLSGYQGMGVAKLGEKEGPKIRGLHVLHHDVGSVRDTFERTRSIVGAENLARRLFEQDHSIITPDHLANTVHNIVSRYDSLKVLHHFDKNDLSKAENGSPLRGIGAVARASPQAHQMVVRYTGNPESKERLVIILKGVGYDTGGTGIKPGEGMDEMDGDMGGSAVGIGDMEAVAALNLKINVDFYYGFSENNVGYEAYKAGEGLYLGTDASGKPLPVIWIGHTDAEGRVLMATSAAMVAADPETKGNVFGAITRSTLTGAMVKALGAEYAGGLIVNPYEAGAVELLDPFLHAGDFTNERYHHIEWLPKHAARIVDNKRGGIRNLGPDKNGSHRDGYSLLRALIPKEIPYQHGDVAPAMLASKLTPYAEGRFGLLPVRADVMALGMIAQARLEKD